ncbi:MAG TPA: (2Fe-2S)-binding protein [Bauldia sp.]|nr:(2Fe-2S)-binding protein [Bauldia sp.]
MIICSCNVLAKARIAAAADALARENPRRPVTPGAVFRVLGARPQCGTCFTLVRRIIADAGITFTCPEPLATVAEDDLSAAEMEMAFDRAENVS